jgi:class 3 adenylate cyclase/predicted ATPase
VDELERWLESLGLAQIAPALRANDVDLEILPELSEADLERLGLSLGHRKKLLKAVESRPQLSSSTPSSSAPSPDLSATYSAERRQLTVMFCDLVGSTALATRLDPEDLREIIAAYHRCVAETVARFDGFVAKYMGDGVLVYFGYPAAHEDDAERAVRSGLALATAVGQLQAPEPLRVHVGIATGLVVVGDLVDQGDVRERTVVGETPNLAARLQALAGADSVVIAASTRLLTAGLFEYEDLGAVKAKGFAEPVRAWRVRGESAAESRFEALRGGSGGETPLVGRDEEIDLLIRRWHRARDGDGQIALLTGEPGIGKSRIAAALHKAVEAEPHIRLRYFCSSHHTDSALYPFIAQLQRAAGFARENAPAAKLDKLEALLAQAGERIEAVEMGLLADLLALSTDDRYPPLALEPQRRKEKTFEILLRQLDGLARQLPVLMIFEDAHWIDPTSHELLDMLVERVPRLPVLLVVTFRPEFQPPWTGQAHVTTLALNRLDRRDGAALAERTAGNRALPGEILARILERTDGIPLFIEELTKTILESGLVRERDGRYVLDGPLPSLAIPTTLHASLMARLDRLAPVREVAQIGATIGREFSYELLAAVTPRPDGELQRALDQLTEAGLVFRRGVPPRAIFAFKHALVQDAAYATLLRARRQALHASIAEALEAKFPDTADMQPELLARHYTEAGLPEPAIRYWERAGARALKSSANREAASHFQRGLELLEKLPDRSARAEQELHLLIALGPALMMTRSSTAPEIGRLYSRARELAQGTGRSAELFPTVWGSWLAAFSRGDAPTAGRLADELFDIARANGDPELMLQAYHAAWPMTMNKGDFKEAWRQVEAGLALYRRDAHAHHARLYAGHDPATCAYAIGALVRVATGHPDHAVELIERGLELARGLAHPPTVVHALSFAADVRLLRREPAAVEGLADNLLPLVSEYGSAVSIANTTMLRGWARTLQGEIGEGLAELRRGLAAWRATGSKFHVPYRLARAADACRVAGSHEEGLQLIAEALEHAERSEDHWFSAELHRVRGELLLLVGGSWQESEACHQQAIAVARAQGARLLELRAAAGLARLLREQGKRVEARDLLAPVLGRFSEGFDTFDLMEAKALLEALL